MSAKFPRGGGGGSRTFFCSKSNVTYAPTEFEVTTSKALGGEALTKKSIFDI